MSSDVLFNKQVAPSAFVAIQKKLAKKALFIKQNIRIPF